MTKYAKTKNDTNEHEKQANMDLNSKRQEFTNCTKSQMGEESKKAVFTKLYTSTTKKPVLVWPTWVYENVGK